MKKLPDFYRNLSIIARFTLIIVLAFILLTSSILFSASLYTKERLETYTEIVNSNNEQLLDKIDSYISDIINVTKIPLTYKENDTAYMTLLSDFNSFNDNSYDFQRQNEQIFGQIMTYKNEVNSCYIFNTSGEADYKVKYAIYSPFDPTGKEWFSQAVDLFGKPVLVDTYELENIVNKKLMPVYVFGVARSIVQLKTGSVIGILLVNTQTTYFERLCDDVKLSENQRVLVMHGDNCLFDSDGQYTAQALPSTSALKSIPEETSGVLFRLDVNHTDSYAASLTSDIHGLRVISVTPSSELLGGLTRIKLVNFLQLVFIVFIILLTAYFAIKQVVTPITLLSSMMKVAESGDFTAHLKLDTNNEVGMLAESYNSLIDRINSLIHEVYLEKINANELEFQMLQAQINPHFLYNTLESISMMATINDDDITADMASTLGSILRYSISNLNSPVSLGDEVNHIKEYIKLQEYRFKNQYRFEIDIPTNLYQIRTPKLILQPVVENAIYHGMSSVRSGGLIKVSARKVGSGILEIKVTDNGSGIPEDKLKNLNEYINEKNDLFNSIGLRNVNRRIKLFCGLDVGVIVKNEPGGGTGVMIIIRIED
ncbi:MAG: sensor histidine kinase [Acetatifactor sp.]|nr:sensor histidine kinase [Acetatifactor sp.]